MQEEVSGTQVTLPQPPFHWEGGDGHEGLEERDEETWFRSIWWLEATDFGGTRVAHASDHVRFSLSVWDDHLHPIDDRPVRRKAKENEEWELVARLERRVACLEAAARDEGSGHLLHVNQPVEKNVRHTPPLLQDYHLGHANGSNSLFSISSTLKILIAYHMKALKL